MKTLDIDLFLLQQLNPLSEIEDHEHLKTFLIIVAKLTDEWLKQLFPL